MSGINSGPPSALGPTPSPAPTFGSTDPAGGDQTQSTVNNVANAWKLTQLGIWSNQQFTAMQFVSEQANQLNNIIRGIAGGGSKIAGEVKSALSQNA
jgi:hypothetical protein